MRNSITFHEYGKRMMQKILVFLFWLGVWYLTACLVNNRVLLASPLETGKKLIGFLADAEVYRIVFYSLLRIGTGFLLGLSMGVLFAVCSSRCSLAERMLTPLMGLFQAVPVASFAVILLIWWGSDGLTVAVCYMVVLPLIYAGTLEGLKAVDSKKKEMAELYRFPFLTKAVYLYRDALKPYLRGNLQVALGMSWKSGIAAEVIGVPRWSVGEQLYLSKIYLDTAGVFAWTGLVILLSGFFGKLVMFLCEIFFRWEPSCKKASGCDKERVPEILTVSDLKVSFGDRNVFEHFNGSWEKGCIHYLKSPSGSGKTTLFRVMSGLIRPDGGNLEGFRDCVMMFQEDRLFEDYSPVKNLEMITGDAELAEELLLELLSSDCLRQPCSTLSGGMKRRVALARAMETDSPVLLLDEPFTGMDRDTCKRAMAYIRRRQQGRTILIATHIVL